MNQMNQFAAITPALERGSGRAIKDPATPQTEKSQILMFGLVRLAILTVLIACALLVTA